jgi:hypothetical protein
VDVLEDGTWGVEAANVYFRTFIELKICDFPKIFVSFTLHVILLGVYLFWGEFDAHGSVHLGNLYVQFEVQLDVLIYMFFIPPYLCSKCFGCYFHPASGAQTAELSFRCV